MVTNVHFRIGRTVAGELMAKDLRLCRKAFLVGNVIPDFFPHIPGHSREASRKLFDRLHGVLVKRHAKRKIKVKLFDSFIMGVLSHYAADYACMAHQTDYTETMRRHMRYERDMSRFLKRNPQVLHRSLGGQHPSQDKEPLSMQIIYRACDNFADELAGAVDAVRLVCAAVT